MATEITTSVDHNCVSVTIVTKEGARLSLRGRQMAGAHELRDTGSVGHWLRGGSEIGDRGQERASGQLRPLALLEFQSPALV